MSSSAAGEAPKAAEFFLSKDGETFGPHSLEEVQSLLDQGVLAPTDLLWTKGMEQWIAIGELVEPPAPAWPTRDPSAPLWARIGSDGVRQRLSIGVVVAIVLHLALLVTMTIGAQVFFRLNTEAPASAPPEPAPLEVTMVDQPDEPPPPEPPAPPPPPPDNPPPPPAVPEIPLPEVMTPLSPTPIDVPQPDIVPPTAMVTPSALPAPISPRPVRPQHTARPMTLAPPAPAGPVDAGPSDYLYAPPPPYPYSARQAHQEGTVKLLVSIDEAGKPVSVSIEQSSGSAILDAVAQKQVEEEFRFRVGNSRQLIVPITFQAK